LSQFFGALFHGQNDFFSCHVLVLSWHVFLPIKKPPSWVAVVFKIFLTLRPKWTAGALACETKLCGATAADVQVVDSADGFTNG
jgi:hypothetical protein